MEARCRWLAIGWLSLWLIGPAAAGEAQRCSQALLDALAKQLGQSGWRVPDASTPYLAPLQAAACKPWPDDPQLAVVALAYQDSEALLPDAGRNLQLLVGRVAMPEGRLRERYDSPLGEDVLLEIGPDSLWLDTARYHLAPGVRAFGLLLNSVARGPSCPEGGFNDLLTLLVPEGARLRPVFASHLRLWTTVQGTACVQESDFAMEQARLTLSVGPLRAAGYADLQLTASVQSGPQEPLLRRVTQRLRYDGQRDPVEEVSTFWWRDNQPAPGDTPVR